MERELKVLEGRVRDAAASCATAKEALKVLFPEVFVEEVGALPAEEQRVVGQIYGRVSRGGPRVVLAHAWRNGTIRLIPPSKGWRWTLGLDTDEANILRLVPE